MTRESLSRKFKPAGFEQPDRSRRNHTKPPESELGKGYTEWMKGFYVNRWGIDKEKEYNRAVELVKDLNVSIDETNALLIVDCDGYERARGASGLFVSAVYNKLGLDKLILDIDALDIDFYRLQISGLACQLRRSWGLVWLSC